MGMQVQEINVEMWNISVEIRKMWGIRVAMKAIKVKLNYIGRNGINSNGNDKFKEWREVQIIENEHICKNLVPHI